MDRNSLHRLVLGTVTAGTLMMGVAGQAHADAYAYSLLDISNFTLFNVSQGRQVDTTDFTSFNTTTTLAAEASSNFMGSASSPATQFGLGIAADIPQACVGACPADNTFAQGGLGQFSRGDATASGAAVTVNNGPASSVTATTVAETRVIQGGPAPVGNNASAIGRVDPVITTFTFTVADASAVRIDFTATLEMLVSLDANALSPFSNATANSTFTITIDDDQGNQVFSWEPNGAATNTETGVSGEVDPFDLNTQRSNSIPGATFFAPGAAGLTQSGAFSVTTPVLAAGTQYSARLTHRTQTEVARVPEPATLALFGVALLGLGVLLYRRREESDGSAA